MPLRVRAIAPTDFLLDREIEECGGRKLPGAKCLPFLREAKLNMRNV
jgi:hypothetical protein